MNEESIADELESAPQFQFHEGVVLYWDGKPFKLMQPATVKGWLGEAPVVCLTQVH